MSFGPAFDAKEQVRQAIDIVDLVGSYMQLRRQGRNYVGLCPWHDDSRPSLQVNPDRQSFKCWVCDYGGDVFSFIMRSEGPRVPRSARTPRRDAPASNFDAPRHPSEPRRFTRPVRSGNRQTYPLPCRRLGRRPVPPLPARSARSRTRPRLPRRTRHLSRDNQTLPPWLRPQPLGLAPRARPRQRVVTPHARTRRPAAPQGTRRRPLRLVPRPRDVLDSRRPLASDRLRRPRAATASR